MTNTVTAWKTQRMGNISLLCTINFMDLMHDVFREGAGFIFIPYEKILTISYNLFTCYQLQKPTC